MSRKSAKAPDAYRRTERMPSAAGVMYRRALRAKLKRIAGFFTRTDRHRKEP